MWLAAPDGGSTESWQVAGLFSLALLMAMIAYFSKAARPEVLSRGQRLPNPRRNLGLLLVVLAFGFVSWLGASQIYVSVQLALGHFKLSPGHPESLTDALQPQDYAFLATVPGLVGFVTLLVGDAIALRPRGPAGIGLSRRAGGGLITGLLGIILAMPAVLAVSVITEGIYQAVHFQHPTEHDLLKALGQSHDGAISAALLIGAALCAPLFEEMLFRGHLQTLIRETLIRQTLKFSSQPLFIAEPPPLPGLPPPLPGLPPTAAQEVYLWQSWTAIVFSSVLFTLVHPPWSWPPIFFLALCLGYAYERTGSLYTSMVMHSLFNATQTLIYLKFFIH